MALIACSDDESSNGGGVGRDADSTQRRDASDLGDSGSEAGEADSGPSEDAGLEDSGTEDAGGTDSGSGPDRCASGLVDATVWGRAFGPTVTFAPGGASEVSSAVLDPGEAGERSYVARLSTSGVTWLASAFAADAGAMPGFRVVVHDPAEDAVYAVYTAQGGPTEVRLYSASGTLSETFSQGGAANRALVGERGNFNHILVKYDQDGSVLWASRFGPNDPTGNRGSNVESIALSAAQVRVTLNISDGNPLAPGSVVFGPGDANESSTLHPDFELVVTATFDRNTGSYVTGSARFIEGDEYDVESFVAGNGTSNQAGEFVIAGRQRGNSVDRDIRLGNGSSITRAWPAGIVVTYAPTGSVRWVRTLLKANTFQAPRPKAVALGADGSVVAGFDAQGPLDQPLEVQSSGGVSTEVNAERPDTLVVRWDSSGTVAWTYRIKQSTETQSLEILLDEPAGVAYILGQATVETTFEVGTPTPISFEDVGGWYLLKLDLVTGALEWVEQLFNDRIPVLGAPQRLGPEILRLPSSGDEVRVGRAPNSPIIDLASPRGQGYGWIDVDLSGTYVDCGRVVDAARGITFD